MNSGLERREIHIPDTPEELLDEFCMNNLATRGVGKHRLKDACAWRQRLETSQTFNNTVMALGFGGIVVAISGFILAGTGYWPWLAKWMIIGGGVAFIASSGAYGFLTENNE